jgi:hypothetical protein
MLLPAGLARAGFYDPRDPKSPLISAVGVRALHPDEFRDELDRLTLVADPSKPAGPRAAFVQRRDELLARGPGILGATELAELGMIQWRLRDGDAALTALRQATNRDQRNFWGTTHLGSVYQALGQLQEAMPNLDAARELTPEPWPTGPAAGDWFKKVERFQFRLLQLRQRDATGRPTGGRPAPVEDVDNLFGMKFVGPSGRFEAGTLAPDQKAKLPPDAIAVVQQLVLWFPEDTRLLWLLGELYNADGNLEAASKMLDLCVWSRHFQSSVLREHRRIVREAFEAQPKPAEPAAAPTTPPAQKSSLIADTWQIRMAALAFGLLVFLLAYFQVHQLVVRLLRLRTANYWTRIVSGLVVGVAFGGLGIAAMSLYKRMTSADQTPGGFMTMRYVPLLALIMAVSLGCVVATGHHLVIQSLTRGKTAQ